MDCVSLVLPNDHPPSRRDPCRDVVGFSAMMERDEEGTLRLVKALQSEVIEPKVKERGGRLVKTTGDGFLCEFSSPVEAVRCALEVQDAARRNGEPDEAYSF